MRTKTDEYLNKGKKIIGQALSPAFLLILMSSCLLWYMAKLSHDYTSEIELKLHIDGQKYRVTTILSGRGALLTAYQFSLKKINIRSEELSMRQSNDNTYAMTITEASLQKVLTNRLGDVRIVQIVDIPDFIPEVK